MLVSDAMNKKVVKLGSDETLLSALKKLAKNKISGAPVVDGEKVIGVLSQRDILKFLGRNHIFELKEGDVKKLSSKTVSSICTKNPVTVNPETKLTEAVKLMNTHNINRLPVIKNGKLVGILTRADIIKLIASQSNRFISDKITTGPDKLLQILEKKEKISLKEASELLNIDEETIESWAKILSERGLIEFKNPALGKSVIKKVD
ncbi:MAG: CBS domain-containing protein [Candidatus Micrarchaeota archaeon]|nr:CBS domain-containing protein [Candidatus Micrarchaeota archaeon]